MSPDAADLVRFLAEDKSVLRTPCFVYSPAAIAERHARLRAALGTPLIVSLKANPNVDLVMRLKKVTDEAGVEVASFRELNIAAARGDAPCYMNTPALTPRLMMAAIGSKARLVLDNASQVDMLLGLPQGRVVAPVILRTNASVLSAFAPEFKQARFDQFGMAWDDLLLQAKRLRDSPFKVAGFHLFAGSNSFRTHALQIAAAAPAMIASLEKRLGYPLAMVNLGGGLGQRWEAEQHDFAAYRLALGALPRHVQVAHEAGRAVFAEGGSFVVRVVARKSIGERRYFVCDGGIAQNFLLIGTENRFRKRATGERLSNQQPKSCDGGLLVGSSCSQDDVLGEIPAGAGDPEVGDFVRFGDCGAYHETYPNNGFLGLDPAGAYLIP